MAQKRRNSAIFGKITTQKQLFDAFAAAADRIPKISKPQKGPKPSLEKDVFPKEIAQKLKEKSGNIPDLGNVATHAIVYAQLYVSGVHHGLHVFVVPIRDPETLQPFPGVTVGDMGEKIGLNGIDNGFLLFSHYRIPRAYLLNDTGDVTEEGRYVTPYQNESQRFGASLLALSASRVWVTAQSDAYGGCALTTALRYSAVRRQFAPSEGEQEVAILEYQTQLSDFGGFNCVLELRLSSIHHVLGNHFPEQTRGFFFESRSSEFCRKIAFDCLAPKRGTLGKRGAFDEKLAANGDFCTTLVSRNQNSPVLSEHITG
ncbi:hypothetical protein YQE_08161, partial [Dendroctonus ponderosae]